MTAPRVPATLPSSGILPALPTLTPPQTFPEVRRALGGGAPTGVPRAAAREPSDPHLPFLFLAPHHSTGTQMSSR